MLTRIAFPLHAGAIGLLAIQLAIVCLTSLKEKGRTSPEWAIGDRGEEFDFALLGLCFMPIVALIAYRFRTGHQWARVILTILTGITFSSYLALLIDGEQAGFHQTIFVLYIATSILAVWFSYRPEVNAYFRAFRRPVTPPPS
jgi:hypothetical protein